MTLAPGTKLSPCKILSSIGAGGMGEVKAQDTASAASWRSLIEQQYQRSNA
jgi:hypothetical protein